MLLLGTNIAYILIIKLLFSDQNELLNAKNYLEHAANTNFTTFIKMLSEVLVQAGNSQVARMAAGLQLKNHLTSKDMALRQKYQQQWLQLPEDIQLYVKKNVSPMQYYQTR